MASGRSRVGHRGPVAGKKRTLFKSTLATGSPVASSQPMFGKREEEERGGRAGVVRKQEEAEERGAAHRRIDQSGARLKFEDLEGRKKRMKKMRPRAL